jgi:hypothetical protein
MDRQRTRWYNARTNVMITPRLKISHNKLPTTLHLNWPQPWRAQGIALCGHQRVNSTYQKVSIKEQVCGCHTQIQFTASNENSIIKNRLLFSINASKWNYFIFENVHATKIKFQQKSPWHWSWRFSTDVNSRVFANSFNISDVISKRRFLRIASLGEPLSASEEEFCSFKFPYSGKHKEAIMNWCGACLQRACACPVLYRCRQDLASPQGSEQVCGAEVLILRSVPRVKVTCIDVVWPLSIHW